MNYTINEDMKKTLYDNMYTDYVSCKSGKSYSIPHFYSLILYDWIDNQKKVFHIECEEDLEFFVKNFTYRDIIYIMQCPWRNRKDLGSRFDTDCINGIVYSEYLEEFNNNEFKYFNAVCKYFGVDNYGDDNNPWEERIENSIS